jgi:hypothetical protein
VSDDPHPQSRVGLAAQWVTTRGRRLVDVASGRSMRRQLVNELALLRHSVDDMRKAQRRLETNLQAEFQLRDMLAASESSKPEAAITPLSPVKDLQPPSPPVIGDQALAPLTSEGPGTKVPTRGPMAAGVRRRA